jgi:hypothetical protein
VTNKWLNSIPIKFRVTGHPPAFQLLGSIGVSGELRSRRRGLFKTCNPDGSKKVQKQACQIQIIFTENRKHLLVINKKLEEENRRLKMEREILKKAMANFVPAQN